MKSIKTCSTDGNYRDILKKVSKEINSIEDLSYKVLKDEDHTVDTFETLYTINQKAHDVKRILSLYYNVETD